MKAFHRFWGFLTSLAIVAIVLLAILLAGVRLVGLTPYAVLSGSMEPAYHVGSLIYVRAVEPSDVQVNDPITFVVNEALLVATHRVVAIEVVKTQKEPMLDPESGEPMLDPESGEPMLTEVPLEEPIYYFTTKGDANDAVDGTPVYDKNLIGRPEFSIPLLGYFSSWLKTRQGMIVAVSAAAVLAILMLLPELLKKTDVADRGTAHPRRKRRGGNNGGRRAERAGFRCGQHVSPQ